MFFLLLCMACLSPQQPVADPSVIALGRDLFKQHLSAIGGRTALMAHSSLTMHGRLRRISNPLEHRFVTWKQAPSSIQTQIDIVGLGTVERGYDGETGWERTVSQVTQLPEENLDLQKRSADFYFDANDELWYPRIVTVQDAEFAGRPCRSVQTVNSFGEREDVYFEKESGLKMGSARFTERDEEPIWTRFGHYVLIDDLRMPLSIEEITGEEKKLILIQEVSWDNVLDRIKAPDGMPE